MDWSELDWYEVDLSQKQSECEHLNANWGRSKRVWEQHPHASIIFTDIKTIN